MPTIVDIGCMLMRIIRKVGRTRTASAQHKKNPALGGAFQLAGGLGFDLGKRSQSPLSTARRSPKGGRCA